MLETHIAHAKEDFEKAIAFLKKEFASLQTGRASASLIEDIEIDSYGQRTPIKHVANISLPSAQEIMIDPWDKSQVSAVEKAIRDKQELGLNPTNLGNSIILKVPPLTEERRKELVKVVHQKAEHAKITIRQGRQKAQEELKKMEKNKEMSEDDLRVYEKDLQKEVDTANGHVDDMTKHKEQEVMKV